jgi:hypothetical protein
MSVAIVTCARLPEPDEDERPLMDALRAAGVDAALAAWDDPAVDWARYDAAVLRSTWNYHRAPDAFLAWVGTQTRLWNPPAIVRWNAHKGYLLDLQARGIDVTPTVLVRRGAEASLAEVMRAQGWADVVVKPAVSAGSYATLRVTAANVERGEAHLRRLTAAEDTLVQAYLPSVEGHGERALVWIAGELTHAVRKSPRFLDGHESVNLVPIEPDERAFAERVLAPYADSILYGRVDVARGPDGRPCLMELELIEPSLFVRRHPPALARLVDAIARLQSRRAGSTTTT